MNRGDQYGEYGILREIGRGNMGVVYLALRSDTGQQVALKVVRGGPDPEDRERVEVEENGAALQSQLAAIDAHVVNVTRISRFNGDLNVEMEYIDGDDLFAVLQRGHLDPHHAARIALELCLMLDNLSRLPAPVAHGDLKPRNIRLSRHGEVKVVDFGIAKQLREARAATFNPFQSIPYCSPERLESDRVDPQSDLWSVGVVLYEMVAGRRPFSVAPEKLKQRIQNGPGPDPLPPECPPPLQTVIMRMLAQDPLRRYGSAAEAGADLQRFLNNEPVQASAPDDEGTRRTIAANQPRALPPHPQAGLGVSPWLQHSRAIRLVLFGAGMLLLIWFLNSMFTLSSESQTLLAELESGAISPASAWNSYQALQNRSRFMPVLYGVRSSLKRKLKEAGEEPIVDYRRDHPSAHLSDWERAANSLKRALELEPGDKQVIGRLRICEGHLLRIKGESLKVQNPAYTHTINSALAKFEEAAALMPDSQDPFLGLERIYFYDLLDPDKGTEMVRQAERHGYRGGKREEAARGDSLRGRGLRNLQRAREFTGMPDQQREYLLRARADFRDASEAYSRAADFSPRMPYLLKDTLLRLDSVEDRLRGPAAPFPAPEAATP